MTRPLVLRGGRIIDPSQALDIVGDASITSSVKVDYSDGWFYQPVSFQGAGSHN